MRITDLLCAKAIDLQAAPQTKTEAIDRLVDLMIGTGNIADPEEYKKKVLAREEEGSTGIGEGVAIPHAKTPAVTKAGLSAMVVPSGVDYDSLDGLPTKLFFLIAAPDTDENIHLDVLGRLSVLLMDEDFRTRLMQAKSGKEFLQIIDAAENAKSEEEKMAGEAPKPVSGYQIIGVTACPTGIAHTYMAQEALESAAKDLGYTVKIETNGSGGNKNVLTSQEIKEAECVIIAADKDVDTVRFDGKKLISTKVADGIHKPKELIQEALQAPVFHSDKHHAAPAESAGKENFGRQIYKHLMNGVSHMLPFVIGGGILIALAFLFDNQAIDPSNFGKNLPFPAFLKTVGEAAFNLMLPVLAGYIAMSIADRPGLMVGFVGGMLASNTPFMNPVIYFGLIPEGGSAVSGFLGALLAGFIGGYLMLGLEKLCDRLPHSLEGIKPVLIYPVIGILAMGAIMVFFVNPPISALNTSISNGLKAMGEANKVILGCVLGAMMSIDFGGPFNKAAYVFGTASIAMGNQDIMAAVMIGGMVPPLAIALASTFFRSRFTKKERQSGITNYIMGLSFITEGAIPFAASDPLRVIPACAIGSAAAGGLSMFFGCQSPAPHGGIFVVPVITHPWQFLLSLAIGSIVGMALLGVLKKKVPQEAK